MNEVKSDNVCTSSDVFLETIIVQTSLNVIPTGLALRRFLVPDDQTNRIYQNADLQTVILLIRSYFQLKPSASREIHLTFLQHEVYIPNTTHNDPLYIKNTKSAIPSPRTWIRL